jgi:hypothetical protein
MGGVYKDRKPTVQHLMCMVSDGFRILVLNDTLKLYPKVNG